MKSDGETPLFQSEVLEDLSAVSQASWGNPPRPAADLTGEKRLTLFMAQNDGRPGTIE